MMNERPVFELNYCFTNEWKYIFSVGGVYLRRNKVFIISAFLIIRRLIETRDRVMVSTYTHIAASAVFAIFFESFIDMDLMWADYAPVLVFLLVTIYSGASVIEEEANG